jgi:Na+-driven multidrug efflux pump
LQLSHRRAIWTVAWPAMAIGVLRTLYGVIDAFWIGKLGPVELEAMGAASFATWIILILGELPAVGVHAVSAAHEGSGTRSKVGPTVAAGLWISLFISLALAACLPLGFVHG